MLLVVKRAQEESKVVVSVHNLPRRITAVDLRCGVWFSDATAVMPPATPSL